MAVPPQTRRPRWYWREVVAYAAGHIVALLWEVRYSLTIVSMAAFESPSRASQRSRSILWWASRAATVRWAGFCKAANSSSFLRMTVTFLELPDCGSIVALEG
jgi:hypothetical protein